MAAITQLRVKTYKALECGNLYGCPYVIYECDDPEHLKQTLQLSGVHGLGLIEVLEGGRVKVLADLTIWSHVTIDNGYATFYPTTRGMYDVTQ